MTVLVTGGAGYIGAHVVHALRDRGDLVVVVDDLVTGVADRIAGIPLERVELAADDAPVRLEAIMREHAVHAVVHLAARKQVGESVARPAWYYQQNVGALANVLIAMQAAAVGQLVFSSSAAVYGAAAGAIAETRLPAPINPYGETKLVGEWLVASAARSFALCAVSLRYFNVAGAGRPELADRAALNLVPMVFERLDAGQAPLIFGNDYDTPDGTCVRDFMHVVDLAGAHLVTLDSLATSAPGHVVYNVGTGTGSSVLRVVESIIATAGVDAAPEVRPRRAGDPATVVASPALIETELGWVARFGIDEIVASAWAGHEHFIGQR